MSSVFEAGESVRGLWNDIQATTVGVSEGHLEIAGALTTVVERARTRLELEEGVDEERVLQELQKRLLLATKSSEARSAVIGVARLLKDLGTLGHIEEGTDKKLMSTARSVSAAVLQKMTKGPINSCLLFIQTQLAEALLEVDILPKEYRQALENTKKACEAPGDSEDPILLNSLKVSLEGLKEKIGGLLKKDLTDPQRKLGKKISAWLDESLHRFNEALGLFEQARDLEKRAEDVYKSAQTQLKRGAQAPAIGDLRKLEKEATELVNKQVLPLSVLNKIRVDLACCLATVQLEPTTVKRLTGQIQPYLPRTLRAQLAHDLSVDTLMTAREQIHRQSEFPEYQEAMRLLTRLTLPPGEPNRLTKKNATKQQRAILERFLVWALRNQELNTFLHEKYPRTAAEEMLCTFTFVTINLEPNQTKRANEVVTGLLDNAQPLGALKKTCEKLDEMWVEQPKRYAGTLASALKGLKRLSNQKRIDELIQRLEFPPHLPKWEVRFSPGHLAVVNDLLEALNEGKGPATSIATAKKQLQEYRDALVAGKDQRQKVQEAALQPVGRIDPQTLRKISQYAEIHELLDYLPESVGKSGSKKEDGLKADALQKMQDAKAQAEEAYEHIQSLDFLMQTLPCYAPGTILLDDEVLTKTSKGEGGGRVYSEKSLLKNIRNVIEIFKD